MKSAVLYDHKLPSADYGQGHIICFQGLHCETEHTKIGVGSETKKVLKTKVFGLTVSNRMGTETFLVYQNPFLS